MSKDLIIGIDAGTSVIKSIAFDLTGKQIATAAVPNRYTTAEGGAATQPLDQTWDDCAQSLRQLADNLPDLANRVVAVAVTGQGDGTWLADKDANPVGDAWLWLDARAGATAEALRQRSDDIARFERTGTGLNPCQQGAQLTDMMAHCPEKLDQAATAFHCKDWLYLNLTGVRATDPSEACFTFGDYKTRDYSDEVIDFYNLGTYTSLIPPICDGATTHHPLSPSAAIQTGLLSGTPIVLAYVDVVCCALGAGAYDPNTAVGCTIVGTTGVHIRVKQSTDIDLNTNLQSGYVMLMPIDGVAAQLQTNMAGTLNIDWVLGLAEQVAESLGAPTEKSRLLTLIDGWIASTQPASLLYHPYISDAGERGPFIDHTARSSFIGLNSNHSFGDLVRGTIEGLGFAARDCYSAMGQVPREVRLTGGAARSQGLRDVLAGTLGASVRQSTREEAGAAGAAMIAAVSVGVYDSMEQCLSEWVSPLLGEQEPPASQLVDIYTAHFPNYVAAREALHPIWHALADRKDT
ncbi:FGGY family carbohydrate kinase [Roseobacter sp.]|uniref:FGGY family carbohydrate kinase n=1 Tax=Roseobacter sp. TaxID=1907202 RepID=UPI00385F1FE2